MAGFLVELIRADTVPKLTMDELIRSNARMRVALKYLLIEVSRDEDMGSRGYIRHCAFRDIVRAKSQEGLGVK
jgi:hypothetical protein